MQKVILPFLSGFLAALFFREATLALLHTADLIAATGFSTHRSRRSAFLNLSRMR
ncbi:hypothetical protein CSX04_02569 [Burkholderia cepacia]|nr:hypothetical protein CSX04_02569 [Burkholderia cepacia]